MMNMRHNGQRRPEEIQAEIERTRSELDQTLNAIEQRLTPGQLVDQGLDYLRGSGARQYVQHLGESAKRDPIPLALVGIGLAWLMMVDRTRTKAAQGAPSGAVVPYRPVSDTEMEADWSAASVTDLEPSTGERLSDMAHSARDRASGAAHAAADRVSDMTHTARDRMSQAADSASQAASNAKGRVVQMAGSARARTRQAVDATRERAHQAADTARYQAERVRQGYDHLVQEQPLALGAIGFAIGALLGAAAPRTRREDELMGEASDRLKQDAQEAVREPLHRAAEAASAAAGAAMGTQRRDGDTGSDVAAMASSDMKSQRSRMSDDGSTLDRDESTGGSALAAGSSRGTSDATFMSSSKPTSSSLSANERALEGFEPRPLDTGPGVDTTSPGSSAQPPSYASGPEFESDAQRRSSTGMEDLPRDPPGGR
jgi:ElaB/YqjD/DUF883 family membrane-anchored ribosome-binding protein